MGVSHKLWNCSYKWLGTVYRKKLYCGIYWFEFVMFHWVVWKDNCDYLKVNKIIFWIWLWLSSNKTKLWVQKCFVDKQQNLKHTMSNIMRIWKHTCQT